MDPLQPTDDLELIELAKKARNEKKKQYIESMRTYLMKAGNSLDTAKSMIDNILTEMKRSRDGNEDNLLRQEEDGKLFVDDVIRLANDALENLERAKK